MPNDKDPCKGDIIFIVSDRRNNSNPTEMWSTIKTLTNSFKQRIKDWKGIDETLILYTVLCPKCVLSKKEQPGSFHYTPLRESTCITCLECKEIIPVEMVYPPPGEQTIHRYT